MKIVIGADIVPTKSNMSAFINGNREELIDDSLAKVLDSAAYRVFNLETPLTDILSPIAKCGPTHITPTAAIRGIKAIGADFLTLANNHILDQGESGLSSTINVLSDQGICFAGAGKSQKDAASPHIALIDGKRVGFYCCAEHEFTIVSDKKSGANPYDPLTSFDDILKLKQVCDYIIVLYHGGKEYYQYPSPELQRICRKFVEKGANLIICQHSHCIGCFEEYEEGTIVYGQGNFIFNDETNSRSDESLLVSVDIHENKVSFFPLRNNDGKICIAAEDDALSIMNEFYKRSREALSSDYIDEKYYEFSTIMLKKYLRAFGGKRTRSFTFRALNRLCKGKLLNFVIDRNYNQEICLSIQNYIECEAHRELILYALKHKRF